MAIDEHDECKERREAELEFVGSAYEADEAWCDPTSTTDGGVVSVHRRLDLPSEENDELLVPIVVILELSERYPVEDALQVSAKIWHNNASASSSQNNHHLRKAALDAIPRLVEECQSIANDNVGEESVFLVLNRAEEWIQVDWKECMLATSPESKNDNVVSSMAKPQTFGRRMIWSHEMRVKLKGGGDTKKVAQEFKITGYMKIGWPGLMLIEGNDDDCDAFFEEIRPRVCHPVVIRGTEHRENVIDNIDTLRKFDAFRIVEDNAEMARPCKEAGLWELFCTGLKGLS